MRPAILLTQSSGCQRTCATSGAALVAAFFFAFAPPASAGQQDCRTLEPPYVLDGRVIAASRLPDFVEVRLEAEGTVREASAYADGNGEFTFTDLAIDVDGGRTYYLVIEQEGFLPYRELLDWRQITCNYGGLTLFLETAPPESTADGGASPAVDIRLLLAEIPPDAAAAYEQAMAALERGDSEAGMEHLERAVDLAPDYYDALNKLGIEYLKASRYRDAEVPLERARGLNPNDPRPLVNLGMLHLQEGQAGETSGETASAGQSYSMAAELLAEALRLDPLAAEAHFYLGSALYEIGALEEAEASLLEALGLDPALYDAHLMLLNVYTRQQRYSEALDQIAAFLVGNPDSPQRGALEAVRLQIEGALGR